MVVLIDLVRALLAADVLVRVVLVVGIYVPALDVLRDILRTGEVPFTLEVTVLDEISFDFTVLFAPFGLQGKVCHAEGIDRHTVTIDEYASVSRHGVAVSVVLTVGVVERTSVGRVTDTLLRDEDVLGVLQTHGGVLDVALESQSSTGHGIGQNLLGGIVRLGAHLYGESSLVECRCIETLGLIVALAFIDRILRKVLGGQWRSVRYYINVRANVARAQNQPPLGGD